MDKNIFKGQWKQLRGELQKKWGQLTNDDFDQAEGDYDKFTGRLQERYGYGKDEAEREFSNWWKSRS